MPVRPAVLGALLFGLGARASVGVAQEPAPAFPVGVVVERVSCVSDPTQTYSLYLPTAYPSARRWPLVLVLDPGGRGAEAAGRFKEAAERHGWIVMSSHDTRSDAPTAPNERAIAAMWRDAHERFASDPRRIYAAGFSGMAVAAVELGHATPDLAGAIAVGGRYRAELRGRAARFPVFLAAGRHDFNLLGTTELDAALAAQQATRRLERFDGEHEWMPGDLVEAALGWFEVLAIRAGRRPQDEAVVAGVLASEMRAAQDLEAAGRRLEAWRRYEVIAATFEGLADTGPARARADALAGPALDAARREDARWRDWEEATVGELRRPLTQLVSDPDLVVPSQAEDLLRIRALKTQAKKARTEEGDAAERMLRWLLVQTSYYLWRDLMAQHGFVRAAFLQQVAMRIDAQSPVPWFRLALSHGAAGDRKRALSALEESARRGLRALDALDEAPELAAVRLDPAFARVRATVEAAARSTATGRDP